MNLHTRILLALIGAVAIAFVAIRLQPFAADAGVSAGRTAPADEVAGSGEWRLVWSDDFEGKSLDRTKWQPEVSCWGGGNNERQCYVDSSENIEVRDGMLRLIARQGAHEGPLYPEGMAGAPGGMVEKDYTSGKLRTRGLAAFKYGRFSARIKLPAGQGTWSAFWMMPEHNVYGDWPLSGEVDIMEAVNLETACAECRGGIERRTSGALHYGEQAPGNEYLFSYSDRAADVGPSGEWREYAVEWAEGTIQWFVDGQIFMRLDSGQWFTGSHLAEGRNFAPFDQPFHIALNLAVGGNLAEKSNGMGFDPASFPADMQVDWVRVEQCVGDLETGKSCLSDQTWNAEPLGPWEVQAR